MFVKYTVGMEELAMDQIFSVLQNTHCYSFLVGEGLNAMGQGMTKRGKRPQMHFVFLALLLQYGRSLCNPDFANYPPR